jgi:hypothetical protein
MKIQEKCYFRLHTQNDLAMTLDIHKYTKAKSDIYFVGIIYLLSSTLIYLSTL